MTTPEQARRLIARTREETVIGVSRQEIVDLIETIMVYKFTFLSWEEIEVMLGLDDLKQSRAYQERDKKDDKKGSERS